MIYFQLFASLKRTGRITGEAPCPLFKSIFKDINNPEGRFHPTHLMSGSRMKILKDPGFRPLLLPEFSVSEYIVFRSRPTGRTASLQRAWSQEFRILLIIQMNTLKLLLFKNCSVEFRLVSLSCGIRLKPFARHAAAKYNAHIFYLPLTRHCMVFNL